MYAPKHIHSIRVLPFLVIVEPSRPGQESKYSFISLVRKFQLLLLYYEVLLFEFSVVLLVCCCLLLVQDAVVDDLADDYYVVMQANGVQRQSSAPLLRGTEESDDEVEEYVHMTCGIQRSESRSRSNAIPQRAAPMSDDDDEEEEEGEEYVHMTYGIQTSESRTRTKAIPQRTAPINLESTPCKSTRKCSVKRFHSAGDCKIHLKQHPSRYDRAESLPSAHSEYDEVEGCEYHYIRHGGRWGVSAHMSV